MGEGVTMEDHKSGVCNVCDWRSVSMPESVAKRLGVHHVILTHPEAYIAATGKVPPIIGSMELFELDCFTDYSRGQ